MKTESTTKKYLFFSLYIWIFYAKTIFEKNKFLIGQEVLKNLKPICDFKFAYPQIKVNLIPWICFECFIEKI